MLFKTDVLVGRNIKPLIFLLQRHTQIKDFVQKVRKIEGILYSYKVLV